MTGIELLLVERRYDRAYDEQYPSTMAHPNGTLVCCQDRDLVAAMMRALLGLHGAVDARPRGEAA